MKSVCEGVELSDAVSKVVKACSVRTTNPLLECIKITAENDGMILLATDGELSIRKKIRAEIFEEGSVCVPGKYFAEFIKRLEREQISLSTEGERLDIRYADSVSSLQTLPAEDFPRVDAVAEEQKITVLTKDLKDLIAKTVFCCAQDDSRPVLKGVLMQAEEDTLRFTALDGYRMALCSRPIEEKSGACKLICPGRALTEIARMLGSEEESVEIFAQHNALRVSIDDTELTARLYEGEFVNVSNIIPHTFASTVVAEREPLAESVERAAVLAKTDKSSIVVLDVKEEGMNVSSNTSVGRVDENVKIALEGKDVTIALNSKYLSECIGAVSDERIRIGFNGPVAPCVVTPEEGDEYLYLILPVRTS